MIHSVQIDGQTIPLTPPSILHDASANLFSSDSMMLFIGPNGTGKTTLLDRIAMTVLQPDPVDVEYEGNLSQLHVISLTLSPFKKLTPAFTHERLHSMFRKRIGDPIIPAASFLSVLASEFDLSAEAELNIEIHEGEVFRELERILFTRYRNPLKGPERLVEANRAVTRLEEEVSNTRRIPRELRTERDIFDSATYASYEASVNARKRMLLDILKQNLGDEFAIHMRALALALPKNGEGRPRALRSIVWKFGIELEKPPTVRGFEAKFEACLQRWREFGNRLHHVTGDPSLRRSRYKFGLDRLEQMKEVPLDGLASVSLADASSGMAALITQFSLIDQAVTQIERANASQKPDLLLLIDEGDVFLHVAWQQRYVKALNSYAASLRDRFGCIQAVLTTHSPVMMSDFPRDHIVRLIAPMWADDTGPLDGWTWADRIENVGVSFGAPLETIIRETGGAGTMGRFAEAVIEDLIKDIRDGVQIAQARIDMIDDPMLRRLLNASAGRINS